MKQNPLPLADRLLADPDYAIRVFRELKQERSKRAHLEKQTAEHRRWAAMIRPKLDFFDRVLRKGELLPTAIIAADYSMTERDFADMLRVLDICSDTGYGLRLMPRMPSKGTQRGKPSCMAITTRISGCSGHSAGATFSTRCSRITTSCCPERRICHDVPQSRRLSRPYRRRGAGQN